MKKYNFITRVCSICMCMVLIIALSSVNAFASENTILTGVCGETATYVYDETTNILIISGSGAIDDFAFSCYDNSDSARKRIASIVKTIFIDEGITEIGTMTFDCCKATTIELPNSLESIGRSAFYCSRIKEIYIPDTVSSIELAAFNLCQSLESVRLPNNISSIKESTFSGCDKLESINVPSAVTSIEKSAFSGCCSPNLQLNIFCNVELEFNNQGILGSMGYKNSFCGTINVVPNSKQEEYFLNNYSNEIENGKITIQKTLSHQFAGLTEKEEGTYIKTCNICNEEKIINCQNGHSYFWHHEDSMGNNAYDLLCSECEKNFGRGYLHNDNFYYIYSHMESGKFHHKVYNENAQCLGLESCSVDRWYSDFEYHEGICKCHLLLCEEELHEYANNCDTVCNDCGATRSISHIYTNSCDTKCNVCSATRTITHSYTAATCTKAKTCNICGATSGKALGHKYNSGKITKAATCKAFGVKTYTCSVCKGTKTETIAKLTTHTYSNSCDTTCNVCKAKRTIKHSYSNNCDTSCNVCKATRTISHAYKTTTTKATLTKNGSIVKKCTVCGKVASNTAIKYAKTFKLSTTSYTYNGKAKTPSVTVKDSTGKTLKKNTDYTVTYASGRKNVGTYKVTIKMKGKYTGTKTLTFKINPATTKVSKLTAGKKSITVNISKKSTQVTGYQIQYSTSKKFSKATTKTISSYKTTKHTLKSLSAKKKYYVRVRTYKTVGKTKYYSGWSTYKYVKTK